METTDKHPENNPKGTTGNTFPSKNFSQRHQSQPVDNSEPKSGDAAARENSNTGDWDDMRDTAFKDEHYSGDGQNDNSGGAGSTGSAATNS